MNTKTKTLKQLTSKSAYPRIGLALGSGSARGWAHIGVIQALGEMGVEPEIIAGTSIGAIVGAAYAGDQIDMLDAWVRSLSLKKIVKFLDMSPLSGGFIQGDKLYEFARSHVQDMRIESLSRSLGVVATDLNTFVCAYQFERSMAGRWRFDEPGSGIIVSRYGGGYHYCS